MESTSPFPPVVLTDRDHEKLSSLVGAMPGPDHAIARYLSDELERASIVHTSDIAANVVAMYSDVEFRDETNARTMRVRLVYPRDADISARKLSVLTPVGAALIGLAEGSSIEWEDRNGNWRTLTVLKVS